MTWDELCNAAAEKPCWSQEIKAKDEAREQVRGLVLGISGHDIDSDECPEDEVDMRCSDLNIVFDSRGNITSLEFPDWVEDIIYQKKIDECWAEDLYDWIELSDMEDPSEEEMKMLIKYCNERSGYCTERREILDEVAEFLEKERYNTIEET